MDISAHAILLPDRSRRAIWVTSVRTRREDRSSIVVSSSRRTRRVKLVITSSTASFLTGGTEPDQRFHVKADTAVAARCNRDRKRDQFFGLPVQGTVAASRLRQRREGLHGVGDVLAQFSQIAGNALSDVDVIFFHECTPHLLGDGCGAVAIIAPAACSNRCRREGALRGAWWRKPALIVMFDPRRPEDSLARRKMGRGRLNLRRRPS